MYITKGNSARRHTVVGVVVLVLASLVMGTVPASATIQYTTDENDLLLLPTTKDCPTLTEAPRAAEVWFNYDDMNVRGFYDPGNNKPWPFSERMAQIVCGARQNSTIEIGMYFIRAIGTMTQPGLQADAADPPSSLGTRPESDPEVIYDALEFVTKYRNVKVGLVLDGDSITPASARSLINQRLLTIAKITGVGGYPGITWCKNGCFNINAASVFPYAINHEKFLTISDTIWDGAPGPARAAAAAKPAVLSASGNLARSQVRNYQQEATLVYGDRALFAQFEARYLGMAECATTGCKTNAKFPALLQKNLPSLDRNIWVDRLNPHGTDAGRGTTVTFSPQPSTVTDPFIAAFNNVDCDVDHHVRLAMFKLTDTKAETMVKALAALTKRGCDVKVMLTQTGGAYTISPTVVKALKAAKIPAMCTAIPMHTKVILIGPDTNNDGRVIAGTQNMSTAGLRYSEEHTLSFDVRRASPQYQDDLRRVYGDYLAGWLELSQSAQTCK